MLAQSKSKKTVWDLTTSFSLGGQTFFTCFVFGMGTMECASIKAHATIT
jgi:hypothetical protein